MTTTGDDEPRHAPGKSDVITGSTEDSAGSAIEEYKLRILNENARDGGFALLMACVAYAALLINHIETTQVIPWLMAAIAIVATRFTVIARYFSGAHNVQHVGVQKNRRH